MRAKPYLLAIFNFSSTFKTPMPHGSIQYLSNDLTKSEHSRCLLNTSCSNKQTSDIQEAATVIDILGLEEEFMFSKQNFIMLMQEQRHVL